MGNSETIRENQAIRANLRTDSHKSGLPSPILWSAERRGLEKMAMHVYTWKQRELGFEAPIPCSPLYLVAANKGTQASVKTYLKEG